MELESTILDQSTEADPLCLPYLTEGSYCVSNWNKLPGFSELCICSYIFEIVYLLFPYPPQTMNPCVPSYQLYRSAESARYLAPQFS